MQKRPGDPTSEAELLAYVREHTPERAAVPVRLDFVDAIPLTAVGKVFKPQLRWHAAKRVGSELLADLNTADCTIAVQVQADGTHGSLMTVNVRAAPHVAQAALTQTIDARLNPLAWAHQIVWQLA